MHRSIYMSAETATQGGTIKDAVHQTKEEENGFTFNATHSITFLGFPANRCPLTSSVTSAVSEKEGNMNTRRQKKFGTFEKRLSSVSVQPRTNQSDNIAKTAIEREREREWHEGAAVHETLHPSVQLGTPQ